MNVEEFIPDDLDVQKAVVESLAADKAEQDEKLQKIEKENTELKAEIEALKIKIDEMKKALVNVGDVLAKNTEGVESSRIALLERNPEIDDNFMGETHDHVIEVIKEARDTAEKEGRIRKAQILESILVINEPVGNLSKNRSELEKLFNDNGNILSGPVINELEKRGISHKKGEEYLLPNEILKRTY